MTATSNALHTLDERHQLAFEMYLLGGFSLQEVAAHLGLETSQVQQLIEKAFTKLATVLMPFIAPRTRLSERHTYAIKCLIELHNTANQALKVQAFEQWLASSEQNTQAFQHVCRLWNLCAAQTPSLLYVKPQALFAHFWPLTLLAVALITLFAWFISHATPQGSSEIRSLVLEDASRIQLAPHTLYRIEQSSNSLTLGLEHGLAYIDTVFSRQKPITVKTTDLLIESHSAAFEVSQHPSEFTLSVGRGYVEVHLPDERTPQLLIAGQKLRFDQTSQRFIVKPYPIEHIALWRDGLLFADQERLDRLVERLDRSLPGWTFIPDRALAQSTTSALFKAAQPQHTLRALLDPWGAQIKHYGPWFRVIKRAQP